MSCNHIPASLVLVDSSFNPRKGCELQHIASDKVLFDGPSFNPRKGCELQPPRRYVSHVAQPVSIPARGVSCNDMSRRKKKAARVSIPVRGVSCNRKFSREIYKFLVSIPVRGVSCNKIPTLHRFSTLVSIPVRGVSCNSGSFLRLCKAFYKA